MIRIAVVDDEKTVLDKICKLIKCSIGVEITIDIFESSVLFFQKVNNIMCDIVFFDIDMPEINGFEIARTLNSTRPDITIIFVSNFEHLVFESFEFNPFRFVRKSCLEEDILIALTAYEKEIKRKQDIYFFKTNEAERSVKIFDILYFESMGHDIFIHTIKDKFKIKRERENHISIKLITEQFENKGFIRVHKSFLVNYLHIYTINYNDIILKNNFKINVNPRKVNDIKKIYQKFLMMEV